MSVLERKTLSVAEAGQILGLSKPSAYAGVRAGEIPSIRVGRRYLVPVPMLRALLGESARPDDEAA